MILIIPSISISGGKMAKISSNSSIEKWYHKSPLDLAQFYEDHGVKSIHFVDLDGAVEERMVNYQTLQIIANYTELKVNYSGGIRKESDIQMAFDYGAKSITAATVAATSPDTFMDWMITHGSKKLILGIDQQDGFVATRGWKTKTDIPYQEHIEYFEGRGIQMIKCTDVSRDGLMEGPNFAMYQSVLERFPDLKVVASGGVRSVDDVNKLNEMGIFAVIMARSLYEDRIHIQDLKEFLI